MLLIVFMTAIIFSCNEKKQDTKAPEIIDSMPQFSENAESLEIAELENLAGKYPSEIRLLEKYGLQTRIKNMMGTDYLNFNQKWNIETPIEIEDKVLWTTGCEKNNCAGHMYILILDLTDNNINIFRFENGQGRSFEEKGIIGLPEGFVSKFEQIRKSTAN